MTRDAEALLDRARALLDSPDQTIVGNSARLSAFLARQAVENLIDVRVAAMCGVPTVRGSMKSKLAVLKSLDTTSAGPTLVGAWHQLTGFCHQHAYQLSPTVAEVREQCRVLELLRFSDSRIATAR